MLKETLPGQSFGQGEGVRELTRPATVLPRTFVEALEPQPIEGAENLKVMSRSPFTLSPPRCRLRAR